MDKSTGKSIKTGNLIYKCGGIEKHTIEKNLVGNWTVGIELEKVRVPDKLNICVIILLFENLRLPNIVKIIDYPGYGDLIKNVITGSSKWLCCTSFKF